MLTTLFISEFTVVKNDNKIQIKNTINIKANATVRHQGISLTDAFITNISTVSYVNGNIHSQRAAVTQ